MHFKEIQEIKSCSIMWKFSFIFAELNNVRFLSSIYFISSIFPFEWDIQIHFNIKYLKWTNFNETILFEAFHKDKLQSNKN